MSRPFLSGTVADICFDLVSTRSEYGEERELADLVERRVAELGVEHERIGNSIVARAGGTGAPIALVGHLDTVPNWEDGGVERTTTRIIGRGAADMKGGVAVMFAVLQRLTTASQPTVCIFYDREEGPHSDNGIHRVLAESRLLDPKPSMAIVLEPTSGTIHAGAVGSLNAQLTFHGRSAHAARPWEGENAVSEAFAAAVARFAARQPIDTVVDGLTYRDVATITMIKGGVAHNVVPDKVEVWVNARVAPGNSVAAAKAEIEELAGPAADVHWSDVAPPAAPSLTEPPVADFLQRSGLSVQPKQAWTDVATMHAWGVPAFNYGPGEPSQAHQPEEWVEISALEECERVIAEELRAP
ncbi:MAG: succinyl-diaminopimelate desuccinylase [Actinobacteria bacterium]|nr:succinyl-diaminopimelate desuccinylase [Actinomycetota bacterium]